MGRHQLDGVFVRAVEHHRPLAVDREFEARRGTLLPGAVLDHRRNVVHTVGKPRCRELPRARVGVALHTTHELAVDRDIHKLAARRSAAEDGGGVCRPTIPLRAGVRKGDEIQRRRGRRRGHDRNGELLGEFSNLARAIDRTDGERMLAGGEGSVSRQRV